MSPGEKKAFSSEYAKCFIFKSPDDHTLTSYVSPRTPCFRRLRWADHAYWPAFLNVFSLHDFAPVLCPFPECPSLCADLDSPRQSHPDVPSQPASPLHALPGPLPTPPRDSATICICLLSLRTQESSWFSFSNLKPCTERLRHLMSEVRPIPSSSSFFQRVSSCLR